MADRAGDHEFVLARSVLRQNRRRGGGKNGQGGKCFHNCEFYFQNTHVRREPIGLFPGRIDFAGLRLVADRRAPRTRPSSSSVTVTDRENVPAALQAAPIDLPINLRQRGVAGTERGNMISAQFLLTAFIVVIIPGTGVIYTLALGLGQGRRAAIWAALGCTFGIVPHLLAATLGLAAILHASALLFNVVKFAGVAYLLWLAYGALKQGGALAIEPNRTADAGPRIARRGALINILNPKLSVFFLALLPPFLSGSPATATAEMALLGGVFMALTFGVFVLYGCFAAAFRDWLLTSERAMAWLNRSFAAIFALLAGRLALERA